MKTLNYKRVTRYFGYILLAVVIQSCIFTPGYYIEQEIADNYFKPGAFLKTRIWHNGDIIKSWHDEISLYTPDTIKCYRYKQAKEFVIKLKKIEGNCNNR